MNQRIGNQRGSALLVSLVILLIMTILGVQALSTTALEEKMAGNYRDSHIAFEAAEATLYEAEKWLNGKFVAPVADASGTNGIWSVNTFKPATATDWTSAIIGSTAIAGLASQPRYIIEQLVVSAGGSAEVGVNTPIATKYFYQVTARAVGGSNNSEVILQSTFVRRY